MGFLAHLEELRWMLVKCAAVFLVFASAIAFFPSQFKSVALWPLHKVQLEYPDFRPDLGVNSVMEAFTIYMQVCCVGGLLLATPFILFFVGQFVSPALRENELKVVLPVCLIAMVLFLLGALFSFFFLVPSTLSVSVQITEWFGFVIRWTAGSYYSLLLWLVLGVGAAFEFPLLIVLAVYLGLIEVATLRKYRRHAIVVIFVIAAIVTPTPDPLTQTLLATPLYLLYEMTIWIVLSMERRKEKAD